MSAEMTPVRDAECDPAVESRRARWMILGGVTSVAVAAAINLAVSEWTQELESLADGPRLSTYVRLILTVGGLVAAGVAVSPYLAGKRRPAAGFWGRSQVSMGRANGHAGSG